MQHERSRRQFLRNGSLVAVASVPTGALSAIGQNHTTQSHGAGIKLGIASYTFRQFSRAQLITFLKELRVSDLNAKDVRDHLPMDPALESVALADFANAGIRLHAAGAIYFGKDDEGDIRSKFDYCKRAGVKVIVAGDPAPDTLPHIEKFVKRYNIRFAIHNHGPEDKFWHSPLDVLAAVRGMDPRMGCCIDLGHTMRAGVDPVHAVRAAGPRLFNIHMKDLAEATAKDSQVAVGEGLMPVRGIFEALVETNYDGYVDLEYEIDGDDPMPGVSASFAYMRGVLAGMGYDKRAGRDTLGLECNDATDQSA